MLVIIKVDKVGLSNKDKFVKSEIIYNKNKIK